MRAGAAAGAWMRGRIIRYATVLLWIFAICAAAFAQDAPQIPAAESGPAWDTVTAPAKAPRAAPAKTATKPQAKPGTVVLPAPTNIPDGVATPAAPIIKKGHKGDPVVVQTDLPPLASPPAASPPASSQIVTGAIAAAGEQTPKPDAAAAPAPAAGTPAVPGAVAAAAEAETAKPAGPNAVTLGVYINDIQDLDFRTNSYIVDLYMWFRWTNKDADPIKSVEFMNVYDPEGQQKTVLLDQPKAMPDGSLYNIVRFHGRFSKKFRLEKYPFDHQQLDFVIEDSVAPASEQVFIADTRGISMNPNVSLPGFRFGTPALLIEAYTYPTDFGDLSAASAESYSRAVVSVPISRPMFTLAIKTFGPILLIVICATLVFFINPHFVEGRIGLAITALLTLVAIQFTAAASLPDADYFTMLDKLYMLSYAFIIASLLRVVMTSWQTAEGSLQDRTVSHTDHRWGMVLLVLYAIVAALIAGWVLTR